MRSDLYVNHFAITFSNWTSEVNQDGFRFGSEINGFAKQKIGIIIEMCKSDLMKEKEYPAEDLLKFGERVLHHMYKNHLIHTDIKEENIMICNGDLKLGDFGLMSRTIDRAKGFSGTMGYITGLCVSKEPETGILVILLIQSCSLLLVNLTFISRPTFHYW